MKKTFLLFVALLPLAVTSFAADSPKVVASIRPIHSLVAGVMQGVAEPQLLVKGGGSPHGYVLRPSEARLLAEADLVVWVGHNLESFLEKPLETVAKDARQLELSEALEGSLLPVRTGGTWESHMRHHDEAEHHHEDAEHHQDGDEETKYNPHLWLSPKLAQLIVEETAQALAAIDPGNSGIYQHNADQLQQQLQQLDRDLAAMLAPVKTVPYVVFHDAYHYFEAAYGLNAVGSITIDPERKPGVKRLLAMREKIKTLEARCVFSEPQFEPKLVATITEGSNARTGQLDPVGTDLVVGPELYFQLLRALAEDLVQGLQ
ncbi:zinc transport system substrate-binding protein [Malonomonas rubra DSM 5091]|uniref:Zinc transport system substrate-binding protein n=2 Tax=Malonomonas rubra TaxID=57040 RepID=A0A1M6GHG0_MALRU|nr:zinc transport system substrate-binding protein [Malonomonas rubra DSM 5091]